MTSWSTVLRRVANPRPLSACDASANPNSPESPHQRTVSGSSASSSSTINSSISTASSLPEYPRDDDDDDTLLDSMVEDIRAKRVKKCNRCRGKCLSFVLPTSDDKVVDLSSPETPQFTTPLRPPPRSPSQHFSGFSPNILPASPSSSASSLRLLVSSSEAHHPAGHAEVELASDGEESEYELAPEDDGHSLRRTSRRTSKPPILLIRSTLPHGAPDTRCACNDPFCPGGELDRAYDAVLPCNCGLPGCLGGEMALAWKLRADGLRKSGRHRHVNPNVGLEREKAASTSKGIVWGYDSSRR